MSIYQVINVGRWKPLFEKEFPNGHFLPLPKEVILTQEVCDKFPCTIYGAIQKQGGKVHLYANEPLELDIGEINGIPCDPLRFNLPLPPTSTTPVWTLEEALRYMLESWFNALSHIEKKGKLVDLIFLLARDKKKGIKVTYQSDIGMYKARVIYEGNNITQPTCIYWDESNLRLKVGRRYQQSTGISHLTRDNPFSVPTKYVLLTRLNQIVGDKRGIEDCNYRDINSLFKETFLWLDANSMGEREIYGMKHPLDSTSFQREFNKGMYLAVDVKGEHGKYPLIFPRKFNSAEIASGKEAIQKSHRQGIPVIPEKNGRVFLKSLIMGYKGVNNCWVGYKPSLDGKGVYYVYLKPDKPEKGLNRIHTGTGGNRAEMSGMQKSNIHIVNVDGTITSQYGYPVNYFICMGRGYGGNSGVVPVHKDFHIPYKVRKQFICSVYVDNIPPNSEVGEYIRSKAKAYEVSKTPTNNALVRALADYVKECIKEQLIPILEEDPDKTWKNTHLLTLFSKGKGRKPLKVFHVTGNNRDYSFPPTGIDVDEMVQEGLNCVHISSEMYFKGRPGQPFKLRMLGGKATTLPCEFKVYQSDNSTPYENHIDVLMSNETVKGPTLWWLAYAHRRGPSYLYPNEGILKLENGEVVNFLEPNNAINKWLEENAEEVWVEYKVNIEVLRVLRQEPQFIQEWGAINPNADIHVMKIYDDWALIRERIIGIHTCIPLGYVELSTPEEKIGRSTLTSQQFTSLAILNERLFKGLVEASSWKRDVVERMIRTYIGDARNVVSKSITSNKSEQLFLPIALHVMKNLEAKQPGSATPSLALEYISNCLSSDKELINLLEDVYPNGFTYTHNDVYLPICLSVLQIYAKRDNISQDVMPITAQVLSFIRKLAWAFLKDSEEGLKAGKKPSWTTLREIESTLDLNLLSASIIGWMRALLGDENSDSKVLAALGRITACGQATVKTSHLPSCANYVKKDDMGNLLYSIPIFYLHPDDDLLYILFGKDVPNTHDEDNPYFIGVTRTPLGFWTFGRLIISEEHGWLSHITMNCVVAQLASETDGDGDMLTIVPVTMYDDSLTYEDIYTYNKTHIGYLGYGLQGKESSLLGFYEAKSKWGNNKHLFRSKQHPLIPIKGYEEPDFVSVIDGDTWANTTDYIGSHYLLNVGTGYSAYSYTCFAACKEVQDFKKMCITHIPGVTNTQILSFLNSVRELEKVEGIDERFHKTLISACKTASTHLAALSMSSRIMYEGMGLSGYKSKAYSTFSLYLALAANATGQVISYLEPDMNSTNPLYIRASDTNRLDTLPKDWIVRHEKGKFLGEPKVDNGVNLLIPRLFPQEVVRICEGISSSDDGIYDPITNSYDTYKDSMHVGIHNEVIGVLRKAGYWGFIHSRLKRGADPGLFDSNDVLPTVTYRVLRDFTSGSLGNNLGDVMEYGEHSSMSLYLWTLLNDKNIKWKHEIHNLIPCEPLREMLLRALPLLELVYLYKQSLVPPNNF